MIFWRIDKAKRSKADSFSGEGARRVGGRWNLPGTAVVYASESLALAILESFVHTGFEGRLIKRVAYRVEIPEGLRLDSAGKLPKDWRLSPPPASTQSIGSDWCAKGSSVGLRVPSILSPAEHNLLLNPLHADFAKIRISDPEAFDFDGRMWKVED